MSSKAAAARLVDDFINKMVTENLVSPWKNINRDDLGQGLKARVDDPIKVSSSGVNLCGPAAFFHNLAIDDPEMYAQAGIDLYGPNVAKLGKRQFWASRDLMNATPKSGLNAADWVLLTSLRDHENAVLDYDSAAGTLSGLTMPSALTKWFTEAGYRSVNNESNLFFSKSQSNIVEAGSLVANGSRVCLLINSNMMNPSTQRQNSMFPDHWVVLKQQTNRSVVSINNDNISLRVHSWGAMHTVPSTGELKVSDFLKNYYGYVTAIPK